MRRSEAGWSTRRNQALPRPAPLAQAMLAGVLLTLCLQPITALTVSPLLVAPVIARAVDGDFEHRRVLRLLSALVLIAFGLHAFASTFAALLVLAVLSGAVWAAILPLADSLTLLSAGTYGLDYGRIRRWGSIAFLGAALCGGLLLRDQSPARVLWILLVPLVFAVLASLRLPAVPRPATERDAPPPLRDLLRRRWLLHFLAATALLYASHGMLNGFSTIHWRDLGIGEGKIGVLWTVSVLAEVVLFSLGSAILRRVRPLQLATDTKTPTMTAARTNALMSTSKESTCGAG